MGVWQFINSTAETVKRNAPDLTPVKRACRASYGYCSAAVSKIDDAVRVNGLQKLNKYIPDERGRAQMTLFASKFAQNAAHYFFKEGYKLVPGGWVVGEIVSKTVHDVESENRNNQEMEAVKEVIGASRKTSSSRPVGEIVSKTVHDVESENPNNQEMEAVKEVIGASRKTSSNSNVLDRVEMQSKL